MVVAPKLLQTTSISDLGHEIFNDSHCPYALLGHLYK